MTAEHAFPPDLYRGTAPYYDAFRPPYPPALLEDLCHRAGISGVGRLLDLACGTGQIARPLASHFAQVWAVDQEAESVAFGRARAAAAGQHTIRWVVAPAQTVDLPGGFELIAVGNAFHRLDRAAVARRMYSWLAPGGAVALLWGGTPGQDVSPWQRALAELFVDWMQRLQVSDRVPAAWVAEMQRYPHERVLADAGFAFVGTFTFPVELTWTPASLAGFCYSTSFLNHAALGRRAAEFERDLADRLAPYADGGVLAEHATFSYQLARKPADG